MHVRPELPLRSLQHRAHHWSGRLTPARAVTPVTHHDQPRPSTAEYARGQALRRPVAALCITCGENCGAMFDGRGVIISVLLILSGRRMETAHNGYYRIGSIGTSGSG